MQLLDKTVMDKQYLGKHAVLLVERDPASVFGTFYRCDDLVPCLTAGRKPIWLTSLGEGRRPQVHRLLRSAERWALQGFSPEDIPPGLSGCTAARASGNAMSVPVVGCFLEQALRCVQQGHADRPQ
jgi:site-specific DNA-cytosine methylase